MSTPVATYTPNNCKTAFQLNWALSLFWHAPRDDCEWLAGLQEATEADGVRILKHDFVVYWYNLQVCFVNDGRCMEIRPEPLLRMREMIAKSAAKHAHLLSIGGIVADHIHLTLGCNVEQSPAEVATFLHEQPCLYLRDEASLRIWILRGNTRRIRSGRGVVVVAKRFDHRHRAGGARKTARGGS